MRRIVKRRSSAVCCAVVSGAVMLSACGGGDGAASKTASTHPSAPPIAGAPAANWSFERGDLSRWHTRSSGSGGWHAYSDGTVAPDPASSDPQVPFKVPAPPEGRFAAVTDMNAAGSRILYRDVAVDGRMKLGMTIFYENLPPAGFRSPATLDATLRKPNQQFRVDLVDPAAPLHSLAAGHVLATIFRTQRGDAASLPPRQVAIDLSRWQGKTVRLRLAQVDNRGPLRAGVDDVTLTAIGP